MKKLTKEELMAEYGLGNPDSVYGGCTISLNCSGGTISCSSTSGKCNYNYTTITTTTGETYEMATSITCDGQEHKCK